MLDDWSRCVEERCLKIFRQISRGSVMGNCGQGKAAESEDVKSQPPASSSDPTGSAETEPPDDSNQPPPATEEADEPPDDSNQPPPATEETADERPDDSNPPPPPTAEMEPEKEPPAKKKGLLKLGGDGENPDANKDYTVKVKGSGAIELSEEEKALEGAPQGELFTVSLLSRSELTALEDDDLDEALAKTVPILTAEDAAWNVQFDALTTLRRLFIFHVGCTLYHM